MDKDWLTLGRPEAPVAIPLSKLKGAIAYLEDFLGLGWVQAEIKSYGEWRADHSIGEPWNHRRPDTNPLIPMIFVFKNWNNKASTPARPPAPVIDLANIAGIIAYFESYWANSKGDVRRIHLKSQLRNVDTCRGTIYELTTAFHYVRAGATSVTPLFINPDASDKADVLVDWHGNQIEVHCKSKVPGSGNKIHADLFDYLAGCALAYFSRYSVKSIQIKLICSDSLEKNDIEYLRQRVENLARIGLVGDFPLCQDRYVLQIKQIRIPIGGLPYSEIQKLSKPMYRAILANDIRLTSNGQTYHRVCLFDAVSRRRPRPASSLKNSMHEAKKQISGKRPSIMTIHFHDPMDWELANKISNFKMFLEKQLQTPLGRRVGALVLTAEQSMAERQLAKSIDRNLPAIWFQNPHANPQAKLPADFRMSGYANIKG